MDQEPRPPSDEGPDRNGPKRPSPVNLFSPRWLVVVLLMVLIVFLLHRFAKTQFLGPEEVQMSYIVKWMEADLALVDEGKSPKYIQKMTWSIDVWEGELALEAIELSEMRALKGGEDDRTLEPAKDENKRIARDKHKRIKSPIRFKANPSQFDPSERTKELLERHPNVKAVRPSIWLTLLIHMLPWILVIAFIYWFLFRQIRGSGGPGGLLSFGKMRQNQFGKEKSRKTFADVAGIEEAKSEVEEIVGFLKNPRKFQRLGGRIPRGVLLIGAPGTGKTLLAKAIAGEASVPFYSISGSDFVEMFVGVGASRVRDLFQQARENSPCIIFLDEIDAVGRKRGTGLGGGHDEREQTLNAILVEMDGFASDEKIIVMAATNRPDVLDPALLRPGRFDRTVHVDLPDVKGREEILKVHAKKILLGPDVDLEKLAKATPMASGAELENLVNEAALIAVMNDKDAVDMEDAEEARDKVLWGKEKKSRVITEEDRWVTAMHEAGHTLLRILQPLAQKLHKVTIIPRGPYLGATMHLPTDSYNMTQGKLMAEMTVLYGGRIAEDLFTQDVSVGAQGDIKQATELARKMVTQWGMSERLGPVNYSNREEHVFLGNDLFSHADDHSPDTARAIDEEVRKIIDLAFDHARELLTEHRDQVECLAKALMEHESLSAEEVEDVLAGREVGAGRLKEEPAAEAEEVEPKPRSKRRKRSPKFGGAEPLPGEV